MADLPKTMKALVARARDKYEIEEFETPRAGDDDIIIKIEACGICAGDAKAWHGAERFWGGPNTPAYIKPPAIPGHEFIGHVVELGRNVKGFDIGDRVVSDQIVPCWECANPAATGCARSTTSTASRTTSTAAWPNTPACPKAP